MAALRLPALLLLATVNGLVVASPAVTAAAVAPQNPMATPFRVPIEPTKTLERRDILSSLANDVTSVLSALGTDIPSYVASGKSKKLHVP